MSAEAAIEVRKIVKTGLKCNLSDRQLRFQKEAGRMAEAHFIEEASIGHPSGFVEEAAEGRRR